jgi:branched-chain amino acid transport system substrate-binding protein
MTRRSSKVAVARGAAIALALLLAVACGQKSDVGPSTSAAPASADQGGAGGAPAADQAASSTAGAGAVATGSGATPATPATGSPGVNSSSGGSSAGSSPSAGRSVSSGGAGTGTSPSSASPASSAGSAGATARKPSSSPGATAGAPGGGADGGGSAAPPSTPAPPGAAGADRTGVTDTKIRIGVHAPITGAAPFPQNAFDKGKDVYWKYLAEKGGIFGRNVEIVFRDDQFNPSRAVQVCREMVEQEHVFILMGAAGSEQITACARYANSMGVPYLSAGVNEDGLTGLSTYFATSQTYVQQNPVLVSYVVNKLHKTKLAIVLNNTPALNETQQSVTKLAQAAGLDIVRNSRIGKNASDSELLSEANALRASGAEVVYLLTSPVNFIKLATNAQAQAYSPIYMGPGITNGLNIVAEAGCPAIGAAKFLSPFPQLDVIDNLDPDYQKSYQKYNGGKGDDIGLAEWGLSKVIGAMLQAGGKDLSRQSFVAALESGKEFATNVYPVVSYSGSIRFGAKSSHLLEADCNSRSFKTIVQFATGF